MKNKVLHTEWGTAKLQKTGYYRITSKKEGYAKKGYCYDDYNSSKKRR